MRPLVLRTLVVLAVASIVAVGVAGAGVGRWGPSHGPEGASVAVLAIDPVNSAIVYAGTDHGVFKTANGGRTWRALTAGLTDPVSAVAIDPKHPATVYVGTHRGLFKSANGGRSWKAVSTRTTNVVAIDPKNPATIYAGTSRGVYRSTNAGGTWRAVNTGLTSRIVWGLAIDPQSPATVYAAAARFDWDAGVTIGGLFKTTDGGGTWLEVKAGIPHGIAALAIDPQEPSVVYMCQHVSGEKGGTFRSVDGGGNWVALSGDGCSALDIDFSRTPPTIYLARNSSAGVAKSVDGGLSWEDVGNGLPSPYVRVLAVDARRPQTLFAAALDGVFKSTDGGVAWRGVNSGLIGRRIQSLAVDPRDSKIVYAGGSSGLYRSKDGGAKWQASGLSQVYVGALAIDPLRPSRLYASGSGGLYRSTDGGHRWRAAATPLLKSGVWTVAVDPKVSGIVYAITGNGWLPMKSWRLVKSSDSGKSWRAPKPGLSGKYVFSIAFNPRDTRTLYAGTWPLYREEGPVGGGVFKSTNGGRTWKPAGLAKSLVSALAVDPQTPATVYAVAGGIFKSTDAGRTWRKSGRGIGPVFRGSLAIDPRSPTTLYAAVCLESACLEGPGVFRSTNGGKTWRPFNQGLRTPDVLTLAIDSTGRTLYAGTGAGVYDYRFPR